jgi:hypothetical protein
MTSKLPPRPDLAWLKKAAKERLAELRNGDPSAKLHQAQLDISREYGFVSWRALKEQMAISSAIDDDPPARLK